ncbi:MAG: Hsp70 family protein [Candidatus Eisenbacteria bacterium]|uniref:Hsp70 family protein n=1 Tax=Eiseniibacteriota bacterium TaxID=2212470 RepID=A0A933SD25_UNCEI|nr:Hsp70 family protein [Candidatus Eisenbacteria bacterium]
MNARRIFGIDLGTTYSCIAHVDENGKPVVIPNSDNEPTTPSAVYFENKDNIVVGKQAKNYAKIDEKRVRTLFKRSMGLPDPIIEADGVTYTPEHVSAYVLRQLAKDAEQALGEPVTDVVITCPAYFGTAERTATEQAGKIADLNVHYVLSEPTAAAIYYGVTRSTESEVVLVYDLGGGTFDVTVISIQPDEIRVVCTNGDHNLGGKDWDDQIVHHLAEQFCAEHPALGNPLDEPSVVQELYILAEEAKKALSLKEKAPVWVSFGGERTRVDLTRAKLEELTSALLERTIGFTRRVVEEAASLGFAKIDRMLLVGGLSKMPIVSRRLQEVLALSPQMLEPDLAVAKGAALMGMHMLAGKQLREVIAQQTGTAAEAVDLTAMDEATLKAAAQELGSQSPSMEFLSSASLLQAAVRKVTNVCSKAFGICIWNPEREGGKGGEEVTHLIPRNTPLPANVTEEFGTVDAGQTRVLIQVMEQSGEVATKELCDNKELARGVIPDLPAGLPAGSPIEVRMTLTEDGLLLCHAAHRPSGRELKVDVKITGTSSDEEVAKARGLMLSQNVKGEVS